MPVSDSPDPVYFESPGAFRAWLEEHGASEDVVWVGYWKKATGRAGMTWTESVREALCFGWIDGIRRSVDDERYTIRFTPRRSGSHWSRRNLEMVDELRADGRMRPAGLAAWEARDEERIGKASYEREKPATLAPDFEERLRADEEAWRFFREELAPGYRRTSIHWVMSAKRPATRERRFGVLLESCREGVRIPLLRR